MKANQNWGGLHYSAPMSLPNLPKVPGLGMVAGLALNVALWTVLVIALESIL